MTKKHPLQRHAQGADNTAAERCPPGYPEPCRRLGQCSQQDSAIGIIGVQGSPPAGDAEQLVGHIIADEQPVDKGRAGANAGPGAQLISGYRALAIRVMTATSGRWPLRRSAQRPHTPLPRRVVQQAGESPPGGKTGSFGRNAQRKDTAK